MDSRIVVNLHVSPLYGIGSSSQLTLQTHQGYDETTMYYSSSAYILGHPTSDYVIVDGANNQLVAYTISSNVIDYEIVKAQANLDDFRNYFIDNNPISVIEVNDYTSFQQLEENKYQIVLSIQNLSLYSEISDLMDQLDGPALTDQEITMTSTFDADGLGLKTVTSIEDIKIEINGGSFSYDLSVISAIRIAHQNHMDLSLGAYSMILPSIQSALAVETRTDVNYEYIIGDSKDGWGRVYLEPGTYQMNLTDIINETFQVFDSTGTLVSSTNEVVVNQEGYYDIHIRARMPQSFHFMIAATPNQT